MFFGTTALSLDAKGRLMVPARHRVALTGEDEKAPVVLSVHPHRCLLLYPEPAFAPIRDKVLAGSSLEPQSAMLKRLFVGLAQTQVLDTAGRLLIDQSLREIVQLEKKVWLVGQGDHFEIWSDAGWEQQKEKIFSAGANLLPAGWENLPL